MTKKINNKSTVAAMAAVFLFGFVGPIAALAAGPAPINLLSAGNFAILSQAGITDTGSHSSVITGNIGSSPITAAAMSDVFCSEISGTIYGVDAAYVGSTSTTCFAGDPGVPAVTPPDANKTLVDNAVGDMVTAYNAAAAVTNPTATELGAGNIGGMTLAPGLYKWSTDVDIPTSVTLSGGPNDVWIFQIAGNLNIASAGSVPSGIKVILAGGAQPQNVFWQVGGTTGATLGTYSTFNGNILSATQVIMQTGAVLNGRAFAQTQVTLDANTVTVPSGAVATPTTANLHVIKLVINSNGGVATPSDFNVHVKNAGVDVSSSPQLGTSTPGTAYVLPAGTYAISEDANSSYASSFSIVGVGGDCNASGSITLAAGDNKTCTIVNSDIPALVAPPAPVVPAPVVSYGGGGGGGGMIVPLIGITKVPTPLTLPTGPGSVTYNYNVWNVGGEVPLTNVTVTDDACSPVTYVSGDTNSNGQIDLGEAWKYTCTTTLAKTTTNTAIATGHGGSQTAVATAVATVVVGSSVPGLPNTGIAPAPLINLVKVPSQLTPFPYGGGNVVYTYTVTNPGVVPMSGIVVADNKCAPVSYVSGDANGNGVLDPGETWMYNCGSNVPVSTTNIATAKGSANGMTAISYAFSTVLVAAPGLPNTGFPPRDAGIPWGIIALAGIGISASVSLIVVLKRRRI
jgi:uncharacterized repeat protein (TIGR01451 family)